MRIAAVDLVSNTCFPALAADELGFYKAEGLDARIELVPMMGATKALRSGRADAMIAGSVHDILTEFPRWEGAKLVVALSQGTPWLLVVRADLAAKRGDLNAVKGLRLTAAEGPDLALRRDAHRREDRSGQRSADRGAAGGQGTRCLLRGVRCPRVGGRANRWLLGQRYGWRNCGAAGSRKNPRRCSARR